MCLVQPSPMDAVLKVDGWFSDKSCPMWNRHDGRNPSKQRIFPEAVFGTLFGNFISYNDPLIQRKTVCQDECHLVFRSVADVHGEEAGNMVKHDRRNRRPVDQSSVALCQPRCGRRIDFNLQYSECRMPIDRGSHPDGDHDLQVRLIWCQSEDRILTKIRPAYEKLVIDVDTETRWRSSHLKASGTRCPNKSAHGLENLPYLESAILLFIAFALLCLPLTLAHMLGVLKIPMSRVLLFLLLFFSSFPCLVFFRFELLDLCFRF